MYETEERSPDISTDLEAILSTTLSEGEFVVWEAALQTDAGWNAWATLYLIKDRPPHCEVVVPFEHAPPNGMCVIGMDFADCRVGQVRTFLGYSTGADDPVWRRRALPKSNIIPVTQTLDSLKRMMGQPGANPRNN